MCNKQTETSNRKYPQDLFRIVEREDRKVTTLFSLLLRARCKTRRLFAVGKRKETRRDEARREKKRSRLMEKIRKQQENKQPRMLAARCFCIEMSEARRSRSPPYFCLFLRERSSPAKWTLRDTKRRRSTKGTKTPFNGENISQTQAVRPFSSRIIIAKTRFDAPSSTLTGRRSINRSRVV